MSEENSTSKLSFIEISAIVLFLIGVVMIFVSRSGAPERDREFRNALRYQHVSELADAMWQLTVSSPEFVSEIRAISAENTTCSEDSLAVSYFSDFLIPEYFDEIPQDPSGAGYHMATKSNARITVCSPFGEDENGDMKNISITR